MVKLSSITLLAVFVLVTLLVYHVRRVAPLPLLPIFGSPELSLWFPFIWRDYPLQFLERKK